MLDAVLVVVVLGGGGNESGDELGHATGFIAFLFVIVEGLENQLDCGKNQESAKDVERPAESLYKGSTENDEDKAQDQRNRDTNQQHLAAQTLWHRDLSEDDQKDENIVHRQAVFGYPAGDVFGRVLRTPSSADNKGK